MIRTITPLLALLANAAGATAAPAQQSVIVVRLVISETGTLESCDIAQSSGNAGLDDKMCGVLKERGRWTAALDENGKPVKSEQTQRIVLNVTD